MTTPRVARLCAAGLMLALLPSSQAATQQSGASESSFLLRVAESRARTAHTEETYLAAAEAFRRAYDSGARNHIVLGNMGNLLIHANQRDDALPILEQAERLAGTTWEIKTSLELSTRPRSTDDTPPSLSWMRVPLFWHYKLPASTRMTVAVSGWCLLWLALIIRVLGLNRSARPLLIVALITLVMFGSSAVHSLLTAASFAPRVFHTPLEQEASP